LAVIRRASWGYAAGFAVLSALLGSSLFVVPYLPTNDGPEHVLAAHIEDHYGDPGSLYRETLLPTTEYASHGFALLFGPASAWLGWERGLQVTLVAIVFVSAWGFVVLVRAVEPRRIAIAFLGFPLALTWELYMGFFPFTFASALGLVVLGLAAGWREPTRLQRVVIAFLLLLQAVCHVFAAVLTGAVIATLLVARARRGRRLSELAGAALIGLPAAGILLASVTVGRSLTKSPFAETFLVLPLRVTLACFPRLIAPGPWWRALVFAVLVAGVLVVGALRLCRRETSQDDRVLFVVGAVFLALAVTSPMNIPGWQFFSPRFAPIGALLCLATMPLEQVSGRVRTSLSVALFVAAAASLVLSRGLHRRLAASASDAIAGLSAPVERHAFWLPVTLAPEGTLPFDPAVSEVPFLAPLRHIASLYAVVEGGLPPYTFANTGATYPFVVRADGRRAPPIPAIREYAPEMESDVFDHDRAFRRRVEDELATYGMFYEGVLVTEARPSDLALWHARGYAADWEHGTVLVGHFVPCPLDVDVWGGAASPRVDVGVGAQTILRDEQPEPRTDGEGVRHLALPRSPCGDVWVRPHWDGARADGAEGRAFCRNASATGELRATLTWGSASVRCDAPGL
jgi:hypothetical protein